MLALLSCVCAYLRSLCQTCRFGCAALCLPFPPCFAPLILLSRSRRLSAQQQHSNVFPHPTLQLSLLFSHCFISLFSHCSQISLLSNRFAFCILSVLAGAWEHAPRPRFNRPLFPSGVNYESRDLPSSRAKGNVPFLWDVFAAALHCLLGVTAPHYLDDSLLVMSAAI